MKVFVAALLHESSSFSPVPTGRAAFAFERHRPAGGRVDARAQRLSGYGAFVRAALADGCEVYASSYSFAQPSAPCSAAAYNELRDEILSDLESAGPFDMVLLFLHGAQMAQGIDDCEGDLLARVRAIVGPKTFVGALLDLHGNVSAQMLEAATILAACRNYPHTDFDARAEHLFAVGKRVLREELTPRASFERVPILGMFYTTEPQMRAINEAAQNLQAREGVLSTSVLHGFPWADVADAGAGVLAYSAVQKPELDEEVRALAKRFYAARGETRSKRMSVEAVLDRVEAAPADPRGRPFVVGDACDNAGGGAGSDSTFVLDAIRKRGLRNYVLGLVWDPVVADFAHQAGLGATLRTRLGGKSGALAGAPLDVEAKVLAVADDVFQTGLGFHVPIGRAAALEIEGNIVVVCAERGQVFAPNCFADLGVDLHAAKAVVVKSSQHFYDQFAPIAREVLYCETPSWMTLNFQAERYKKVQRPIWPLDEIAM